MSILDRMKHMVVDDEPATAAPIAPTPQPSPPQTFNPTQFVPSRIGSDPNSGATTPIDSSGDEAYKDLLDKTNFNNTKLGKVLSKYLPALEGVLGKGQVSFKAALAQAKQNDGITDQDVANAYDGMKQALDNARASFTAKAQEFQTNQIAPREQSVEAATNLIKQKQEEINQAETELSTLRLKMQRGQSAFIVAADQRGQEIEREKTEKLTLLG